MNRPVGVSTVSVKRPHTPRGTGGKVAHIHRTAQHPEKIIVSGSSYTKS